MTDEEFERLPITQKLLLELLCARHRLGEQIWTVPSACNPALRRLEGMGLVGSKSGVIEKTSLAWLTDEGMELMMSEGYVPPILKGQTYEC